jgi:hypothetical protein
MISWVQRTAPSLWGETRMLFTLTVAMKMMTGLAHRELQSAWRDAMAGLRAVAETPPDYARD